MSKTKVLIYGASIILEGARALLKKMPEVELVDFVPWSGQDVTGSLARLEQLSPDVLAFDCTQVSAQPLLSTVFQLPNLRMVGLEWEQQKAILLQWRRLPGRQHAFYLCWEVQRMAASEDLERLVLRARQGNTQAWSEDQKEKVEKCGGS